MFRVLRRIALSAILVPAALVTGANQRTASIPLHLTTAVSEEYCKCCQQRWPTGEEGLVHRFLYADQGNNYGVCGIVT